MTRVAIIGGGIGGATAAIALLPYLGQAAGQALEDAAVLATALASEPRDPAAGLARYEAVRRPRAGRVVLTARERGRSNHLSSPLAPLRRDARIALRRRFSSDADGRRAEWLASYDATARDALTR